MAIKYYPNRIFKKFEPAIDKSISKRNIQVRSGRQDITASALDVVLSAEKAWQLDSIKFNFSNATSRNYSAKILNGRKVLTDLNDFLYFQTPHTAMQKIILASGFYTGTELASELQTKLNANTAFTAIGLTFTVVYSATNGTFTITPSSSTVKYIENKRDLPLPDQNSIAGHLFGLSVNTEFVSSITSDTKVYGLDEEAWVIDQTASVVTEHYHDDVHVLDIDQSLHLASNTSSVAITYTVVSEEL